MRKRNKTNNGYIGVRQYDSISGIIGLDKLYYLEKDDLRKWTGSGVTSFNADTPDGIGDYFWPWKDNRPDFWLSLPELTENDQKFCALVAVYPGASGNTGATADPNYVFLRLQGNYIVDWGNGVTQGFTSGVVAEYQYNYANIDSSTTTPYGYRQVIVQAYPQAGNTLTTVDLRTRGWTGLPFLTQGDWGPSWLDIKIAGKNISSMSFNGGGGNAACGNLRHFEFVGESALTSSAGLFQYLGNLQKVKIPKMVNKCTNISFMFSDCSSLFSIDDFETSSSLTNCSYVCYGCSKLTVAPAFNTINCTNMAGMFGGCAALISVPTYNTSKNTNFAQFFQNCYSLTEVPFLDTSNGTNFGSMFWGCSAVREIPPIDTSKATSLYGFFQGCRQLKKVPKLNTSNNTNCGDMFRFINVPTVPWMDTSKVTNMAGMFWISGVSEIPQYDTSKVTSFQNFFNINGTLKYMPLLSGVCCSNFNGVFGSGCPQLRVGTFSGVRENISYSGCKMLTKESLNDIFNNLAVVGASGAGVKTITITNTAGLTGCDRTIATSKGWTVVA